MPYRDEHCVYSAVTMSEAVITAACLTTRGIPAKVMDAMTLGGLEGLTALVPGVSSRGIEVWIDDLAQFDEARRILDELKTNIVERTAAGKQRGPVEMVCDKCGKPVKFKAEDYGTIQECPRCGNYMDVGEVADAIDWREELIEEDGADENAPGEESLDEQR